jgi:hypothetical protein
VILRRVIAHLRKQEWTAIGIDFLIVVVGVFVASLVTDWNIARENRHLEQEYLSRLHDELAELTGDETQGSEETVALAGRLEAVANFLQSGGDGFEATGPECAAVVRSHIYAASLGVPPTIEELTSTGRILLIRNDEMRTSIVRIAQASEEFAQLRNDIQVDRLELARKYPALIRLRPTGNDDAVCDFRAMAASPSFINDVFDNSFRFGAYRDILVEQQASRVRLHRALDRHLSLHHVETAEGASDGRP